MGEYVTEGLSSRQGCGKGRGLAGLGHAGSAIGRGLLRPVSARWVPVPVQSGK